MTRVTPRQVAIEVVLACATEDAYANLLLPSRIRAAELDTRDAALATELTYGTLRWQGSYDRFIEHAANRKVETLDPAVLATLRVGAHQLLHMRTPSHAAVNETIADARGRVSRNATGFLNAILRRLSERDYDQWCDVVVASEGPSTVDALAVASGHPSWIVRALQTSLAHEDREDELEQLLEADNRQPRVNLVDLDANADQDPVEGERDDYSPRGIVSAAGDPVQFLRVRENRVRVQDEGSQLVTLAFGEVAGGQRWLDMCAGPGGKAALLATLADERGVQLTANEVVPHRADLVRQALTRHPEVKVVQGDGRLFGTELPAYFDAVLLDAPCSGLGALRRRPESRWRKQPKDVADLTALQEQLLHSAIATTKHGGVIGYVTCSPHIAETHAIIDRVLAKQHDVEELDAKEALQAISRTPLDLAESGKRVQLWPHRQNTDAMFLSLLRKTEQ